MRNPTQMWSSPAARRAVALACLTAAMLSFYIWIAHTSLPTNDVVLVRGGYYTQLAESLVDGDLDLGVAPKPRLLELDDPYDPVANTRLRLHDASLYDGRYYLYFGITPALLAFVPAHVLGVGLAESTAAALFAGAAFLLAALLLLYLLDRLAPGRPGWLAWLGVAALGLANVAPFLLRRPAVYEVAITAGLCMSTLTVLLAARAALGARHRLWLLAGSGVALGLAIGARPHLFLVGVVPLWALWRIAGGASRTTRARALIALGAPVLGALVLLGAYNLARFGSVAEFGASYQLANIDPTEYDRFDLARLGPGLFFYFLAPPAFGSAFPFVTLDPQWPWGVLPGSYGSIEIVAGALALAPLLLAAPLGGAYLALRGGSADARSAGRVVLLLTGVAIIVALVPILAFDSATQRYEADWTTLALIAALLAVCRLLVDASPARHMMTRALAGLAALSLVYSSMVGVALSMVGYYDGLRLGSPGTYRTLEDAVAFVPALDSRVQGAPIVQRLDADDDDSSYDVRIASWRATPASLVVGAPHGTSEPLEVAIDDPAHGYAASAIATPVQPATFTIPLVRGINRLHVLVRPLPRSSTEVGDLPALSLDRVAVTYAGP